MLPTVFGENLFDDFFDDSFGMMNAPAPAAAASMLAPTCSPRMSTPSSPMASWS